MIQKSMYEPSEKASTPAISIISGMVPTNCMANIFHSGSFSSGISFRPHLASCALASSVVRPALDGVIGSSTSFS